ncbi:hypothetical protein HETIRDRAFT_157263 [Heterobasidion irregulare TC 32-1]|uniref:PIN domain-like protein n=1 Tax=Heterobasidion irregulare (strain TC 32-1) TaxID=747525 RepID=W4KBR1_HETIT|nr:uncharacterized protein HETIRDRAFT_157263 [Heterobasidion irregulare TC 32-1]ETW83179.1 hypothetical protein HETIRDRAFT_157263 [Heterobasidion irregulare TC 32-1]
MGVKSLWSLLNPVGRPVLLENMEGKTMAIDSSIWIYQFQATMRDKEGRGLVNAHVLGFLRRICKLLFYGIKPVFVFDGGAPALKRATIAERKRKKSGAAASHVKVAERLLAAQMRRAALTYAQQQNSAKDKRKTSTNSLTIGEDTVFLEDIDNSAPKTPAKKGHDDKTTGPSPFSSSKKNRWHDHDPYRLPDVNPEEQVANVTKATAPDPRLATEEELQTFIDEMRPEDFDVTSPAFRELPTEVQYEIIGDLRLKSRQTSYVRLQNMLKKSRTPLDFSRQQIRNLQQRNTLTQQLLTTNDTIGQAHVSIPVRIASERNKQYVLVKNEGSEGGWVLGIRDEGTKAKPIKIEDEEIKQPDDESEMEMEEIEIPQFAVADPDLRDYHRETALSAISRRQSSKAVRLSKESTPRQNTEQRRQPLFEPDDDELPLPLHHDLPDEDPELMIAMQESIDQEEESYLQRALEASRMSTAGPLPTGIASSVSFNAAASAIRDASDGEDLYIPGRLETALAIANAGPLHKPLYMPHNSPVSRAEWRPTRLLISKTAPRASASHIVVHESDDDMEEIQVPLAVLAPSVEAKARFHTEISRTLLEPASHAVSEAVMSEFDDDMEVTLASESATVDKSSRNMIAGGLTSLSSQIPILVLKNAASSSDDDMYMSVNEDSEDEPLTDWSRSPLPVTGRNQTAAQPVSENWDAAEEMDVLAEEGEFARFVSQVKGKDLDSVRREIDEEIKALNEQKKVAMRDSEDITQQMISQIMIMLRLFGIPYITAPMEAEAQCATLVQLNLVEGIITDDSDVFLFGGMRVFKNMFNQSKTVECFRLADLGHELGLERDKLIQLAYLLGSDYVDGLPGVGPVVAMELLKEFPGNDGLHKFKDWWLRVQSGKDRPEDNKSKFRQRFKKKFKDLYLPDDWPNPAVRDAYYHPTIDESDEPFKWGLPDLDGLRDLFLEELGWSRSKVEELLLPIIQRMNKRGQAQTMNKQGNLNDYFDVLGRNGASSAPRKRNAYASKRLQQVVNDFREQQAASRKAGSKSGGSSSATPAPDAEELSESDQENELQDDSIAGKGKAKGARSERKIDGAARGRDRARGRGRASASASARRSAAGESEGEAYEPGAGGTRASEEVEVTPPLAVNLRPRARPAFKKKSGESKSVDDESAR